MWAWRRKGGLGDGADYAFVVLVGEVTILRVGSGETIIEGIDGSGITVRRVAGASMARYDKQG